MKRKEWRVVSITVWGTFKVFGENEAAALDFIEPRPREVLINGRPTMVTKRGGSLRSDPDGKYRLEWRYIGGTRKDWQEQAFAEAVTA